MLKEISDEIYETEKRFIELLFFKENLTKEISETELNVEIEVMEEKELETSKKKFSNELLRKKEVQIRLSRNSAYTNTIANLKQVSLEIKYAEVGIENIKRKFQIEVITSQIKNKPEVI